MVEAKQEVVEEVLEEHLQTCDGAYPPETMDSVQLTVFLLQIHGVHLLHLSCRHMTLIPADCKETVHS